MSIESKLSGHWTDEELIQYLYGVGPETGHLDKCAFCQERLAGMRATRSAMDAAAGVDAGFVNVGFLVRQRQQIYARLQKPVRWWTTAPVRRWASAGVAALVLGGSALYYQEHAANQHARDAMLSDAQLAQDVSSLANNPEAAPTAPLQALFEE